MAYDIVPEQVERFRAEVADESGLEVVAAREPRDAVSGCDIVVTAGRGRPAHHTIKKGWLDRGAFASLIDIDAYWEPAALLEFDKFTTDDVGQLEHYREQGHFPDIPPLHATLGEVVAGKKPGRESARERTLACNIGSALADMAVAVIVQRRAIERGVGRWLSL
jgi:ornithine cyclodeaminase/alanine dehydrogenase-like protein (mu-crystallin family)